MVKAHKADSFDGGRAASIIAEPELPPKLTKLNLKALIEVRANSDDEDARALAQAIIALTSNND